MIPSQKSEESSHSADMDNMKLELKNALDKEFDTYVWNKGIKKFRSIMKKITKRNVLY